MARWQSIRQRRPRLSLRQGGDRSRKVLATCSGAHLIHDGFSDALYLLMPIWAEAFGLSLTQIGALKAAYSGALACFQVPAGLLSERFGERVLLWTGTVAAGLGYLAIGLADGFVMLIAMLVFAGLASGVQYPLSSALVARTFADGNRRAALGVYNFAGDLGKIGAPLLVGAFVFVIGWRGASAFYGALGILAGVALFCVLRRIEIGAVVPRAPDEAPPRGWGIRNRPAFAAISGIAMIDSATRYGFLIFLPFLLAERGAGVGMVGIALALTFAGGAAGKLVCGLVAERVGTVRLVVLTEIATGAAILLVPVLPTYAIMALLPVIGLALHGTSSVLYGTVAELVDESRPSRAYGLVYTLGIGAGAASPVLFGVLGDSAGVAAALTGMGILALCALPLCPVLRHR